ncbi:DNA topoisomerase 2-associated protein pat1 AltName: Full=Decapping activator and translational repressor pat1 [Rhizoctonia solani AG-1 IB]|uniref:Rhizoctonia solani AG1-IB WGS project CAOJ00000000 data, isolate 7/3/14, contig 04908 n=1 Tax=Thanatephorus cucumeris (strain AG1-IB / isolate 7/3/14) TaxID=1108050 RepID=M5BXJ9_THACB|nr:DNA topoisomerase 2-associated protein pat1 AltName: Full=Decapping activator and translational repressor pat1 [Rhizoctonia solani AG-1 IB]
MSFFGFDTNLDRFESKNGGHGEEPIAVYDWGSERYEKFGVALDDTLDELNDETFGIASEDVGKDFDFSGTKGGVQKPAENIAPVKATNQKPTTANNDDLTCMPLICASSLDAIWNDKSVASVLGRVGGDAWNKPVQTNDINNLFPPFNAQTQTQPQVTQQPSQPRIRTLQEIEAEQLARARGIGSSPALQNASPASHQHSSPAVHHASPATHQGTPGIPVHQGPSPMHQNAPAMHQGPPGIHQLPPGMHHGVPPMHQNSPTMHQSSPMMHQASPYLHNRAQSLAQQHARTQSQIAALEGLEREMQAMQLGGGTGFRMGAMGISQLGMGLNQGGMVGMNQGPHPNMGVGPGSMMGLGGFEQLQHQRTPSLNIKQQQQQQLLMGMHGIESHPDMMMLPPEQREAVMGEAMRKIMETERMEEKRRIKAIKIAQMSKYNDLMSQSDKDFITRIQVSQLVTLDPSEDFYANSLGSSGIAAAASHTRGRRRENALAKMATQVERIVNNAKARELEKGAQSVSHLQGALGKVSGRSYKAAPRQLLQVEHDHISKEDAATAKQAAQLGREALGNQPGAGAGIVKRDPLTRREALLTLEAIYDHVIKIEQLQREAPSSEDPMVQTKWQETYESEIEALWIFLPILTPLETSNPHPFASLLAPSKGKRLIPRLTRLFDSNRLDVVREAEQDHAQTDLFMTSVLPPLVPILGNAGLRFVHGLLGLLIESGSNLVQLAGTKPGIAVLTILLSRVEILKTSEAEAPNSNELQAWQNVFDTLFRSLAQHLVSLFPSTKHAAAQTFGATPYLPEGPDVADEPVWQFCAALAVNADMQQQQQLVAELREKVLENVAGATKGWVTDERIRALKLANVNLFLHALGLDSSQIML